MRWLAGPSPSPRIVDHRIVPEPRGEGEGPASQSIGISLRDFAAIAAFELRELLGARTDRLGRQRCFVRAALVSHRGRALVRIR